MRIWIDADACPKMIKDFVFKVSHRLQVPVVLVANSGIHVPRSNRVSLVVVGKAIDEADRHILKNCAGGDLVVTADIPLASSLVDKGVVAINPRGTVYTTDNVKEALATRDLTQELREEGIMSGGPPPLGPKDREKFANAIDRELTQLQRNPP
ncbi:MAG: YaiI/YqxD family protein [SAR324 cluster bacterium]|nr:YaiI/YqxD family protein [SAR324 cluster bacterium]